MSDGNPTMMVRIPKPDGGPAFAKPAYRGATHEDYESGSDGMSLRDYFAGQALAGWLASLAAPGAGLTKGSEKRGAELAYAFADAMIEERSRSRTVLVQRAEYEE